MDADHSARSLAQTYYNIKDPDYYEFEGLLNTYLIDRFVFKKFLNFLNILQIMITVWLHKWHIQYIDDPFIKMYWHF